MGGVEVLPFGLLVFVVGSLIVVQAWAIVDARLVVSDASREAVRAYVEAPGPGEAPAAARRAAEDSVRGMGRDPLRLGLRTTEGSAVRCAVVVEEASYSLPALTVPFLGGLGHGVTVRARHAGMVDPYADGASTEATCGG